MDSIDDIAAANDAGSMLSVHLAAVAMADAVTAADITTSSEASTRPVIRASMGDGASLSVANPMQTVRDTHETQGAHVFGLKADGACRSILGTTKASTASIPIYYHSKVYMSTLICLRVLICAHVCSDMCLCSDIVLLVCLCSININATRSKPGTRKSLECRTKVRVTGKSWILRTGLPIPS